MDVELVPLLVALVVELLAVVVLFALAVLLALVVLGALVVEDADVDELAEEVGEDDPEILN